MSFSFRAAAAAAVAASCLVLLAPARVAASSFEGRVYAGPAYMVNDTRQSRSDSSGPALAAQLDLGLRLLPLLGVHATLLYDRSSWLELEGLSGRHSGSLLGLGLGATLALLGFRVGASAGVQLTSFPSADDPSSGPNGASLGPYLAAHAGHVWSVALGTSLGVHALARYRRSKDETLAVTYDPSGYQLGLAVSLGLEGEPLLGP